MKNDFLKLYSKVFLTSVGIIGTIIGIVSFFFTLESIIKWKSQNDDCAKILMNHIEKHLTSAGKTALMRKEMLGVIDKTSLEKYRVPGAHTGYLPFSVAKEARDYVKRNLELIETWFV
ncbi:MAG: hypothetical protein K5895_05600 [Lachnospiraceae bacterium]|nr:hypothetical protein [Lachnospiraceae bacterium]